MKLCENFTGLVSCIFFLAHFALILKLARDGLMRKVILASVGTDFSKKSSKVIRSTIFACKTSNSKSTRVFSGHVGPMDIHPTALEISNGVCFGFARRKLTTRRIKLQSLKCNYVAHRVFEFFTRFAISKTHAFCYYSI